MTVLIDTKTIQIRYELDCSLCTHCVRLLASAWFPEIPCLFEEHFSHFLAAISLPPFDIPTPVSSDSEH